MPACVSALRLSLTSELKPANAPDQLQYNPDADEGLKGTGVYAFPQLERQSTCTSPALEIATKRKGREAWAQNLGTGKGGTFQDRSNHNQSDQREGSPDGTLSPMAHDAPSKGTIHATPRIADKDPVAFQSAILALSTSWIPSTHTSPR